MKCLAASCMMLTGIVAFDCMDADLDKISAFDPSQFPQQPDWKEVLMQCQQALCPYNVLCDREKLFESCVREYVDGLSISCLHCEYTQMPFAEDKCKIECLLGWCKQSCQDCYFPSGSFNFTNPCDGRSFEFKPADPCLSESKSGEVLASMSLACVESDLEKILAYDPPAQFPPIPQWQEVLEQCQSQTCSRSIADDSWHCDEAQYASCVGVYVDGLTGPCLQCEAQQDPFRAENCKAECLLGWCKQSCQDCMFPDGPYNYTNPCDGTTVEMTPTDPCFDNVV